MNGPIIYWGAYEGACGLITSWTEHGDMVYNHHRCLRGAMLLVLPKKVQMLLYIEKPISSNHDSKLQSFG